MQTPNFITSELVSEIQNNYQTPVYIYSEKELRDRAKEFLSFPSAFGHTVRYAMKANPQRNILKIFNEEWLSFDASSDYEALRILDAGVNPNKIQVSSQELGKHMKELIEKWVLFVATSVHQLEFFGKNFPGKSCGIRVNPGVNSWAFAKISTGGKNSSFGIWYNKVDEIKTIAEKYKIVITKLHFHIGSENTPESWVDSAGLGFDILREIETIDTFDMGWGHKMAIMPYEKSADLLAIGHAVSEKFQDFYRETGRKIHLEMEPGKYLVINSCSMLVEVQDIVDTGFDGYTFLKTNSGMNDMPRVAMYGVQEPLYIMNNSTEYKDYVVVGHCCESSDMITTKLYDSEIIEPRRLKKASIWDTLIIDWVGAYNSGMAIKNYNSFPESGELLLREDWKILEIRGRQSIEDIWKNEKEVI
jgi:diaminopimelate decarboxylase